MKFSYSVDINRPKEFVVSKFIDPNSAKHWQDGYLGQKTISGLPFENGTETELKYKVGMNELLLYETVLSNKLPDSFMAEYSCEPTQNTMLSSFEQINNTTTRFTATVEYSRFSGIVLTLIKTIYPSMFKKQVQKWLNQFKHHVESLPLSA